MAGSSKLKQATIPREFAIRLESKCPKLRGRRIILGSMKNAEA